MWHDLMKRIDEIVSKLVSPESNMFKYQQDGKNTAQLESRW
jgi:hypothetical protein